MMANVIKTTDGAKSVELSLEVDLIKEGDYFVSYCPSLELSSYGDSESDAKNAFDEALKIFIEETQAKGTFEKILLNLGWSLTKKPQASFMPPNPEFTNRYPGKHQKSFNEKVMILV